MLNFLEGHKTHLLALAGALISFAYAMDWITLQVYLALGGLLGFGTTTTLRHGIASEAAKVRAQVEHVEAKVEAVAPTVLRATTPIAPPFAPPGPGRLPR